MRYTKAMRDAQLKIMGEIAPLQDELNEMSSKITFRMDEVQVLILYKDDLSTVSRISHVNFRKIADMDQDFTTPRAGPKAGFRIPAPSRTQDSLSRPPAQQINH